MCETHEECTYVKHHKKKLFFILSAMRHFAKALIKRGYNITYVALDDPENTVTLTDEIKRFCLKTSTSKIVITWPGEYRILEKILSLENELSIPIEILEDDRFLASRKIFSDWAKNQKNLRMEFFYRPLRQKYDVL